MFQIGDIIKHKRLPDFDNKKYIGIIQKINCEEKKYTIRIVSCEGYLDHTHVIYRIGDLIYDWDDI